MSTSPPSFGPQPPLTEEDLKDIWEGYALHKRGVDNNSSALKRSGLKDILGYIWRFLEQVDFLEKVIQSILYHGVFN